MFDHQMMDQSHHNFTKLNKSHFVLRYSFLGMADSLKTGLLLHALYTWPLCAHIFNDIYIRTGVSGIFSGGSIVGAPQVCVVGMIKWRLLLLADW